MKIMSTALKWKITELLDNDDDNNNVIKLLFMLDIKNCEIYPHADTFKPLNEISKI